MNSRFHGLILIFHNLILLFRGLVLFLGWSLEVLAFSLFSITPLACFGRPLGLLELLWGGALGLWGVDGRDEMR